MDLYFNQIVVSLFDRGVVYVIVYIRGGQEMGCDWYENGKLLYKQNIFNDFIDVICGLVVQGWVVKDCVVVFGGSVGGLLMGVVVNQVLQDYWVMVVQVLFVDVVIIMFDLIILLIINEYDEWGNLEQKQYYDYMLFYFFYDNVKQQVYLVLFVGIGLWDLQVQYWELVKWVVRLCDDNIGYYLILFCINMEVGYGGKFGCFQCYCELFELYVFVLQQLGIVQL